MSAFCVLFYLRLGKEKTSFKSQGFINIRKQGNRHCKLRTVVSEVSFFVFWVTLYSVHTYIIFPLNLVHNAIILFHRCMCTTVLNLNVWIIYIFLFRYLSVSHNLLTELPAGLVNLTNLEASVNILGVLSRKDIEAMSSLLRLNLSSNKISRLEVASFNETPRLTHLDLSRNRLRIIKQSTLAALVSLTELSLAENQLEDINGLLTTQTHLSFLNLSSNFIQWFDYAFIPNSLQILDLQVKSYFLLKN